jgi:hypothetical protein
MLDFRKNVSIILLGFWRELYRTIIYIIKVSNSIWARFQG